MHKIWQTNTTPELHPLVESYTVGQDAALDQKLIGYDIKASKAHVTMLCSVGILSKTELAEIQGALDALYLQWKLGDFVIAKGYEDGHTAIEAHLIEQIGDAGKKVHTARSRNDQAMTMMRLYLKDSLIMVNSLLAETQKSFRTTALSAGSQAMPGYTHMQKAMPTTVKQWLLSYADGFADMQKLVTATLPIIDQNPLGSTAGFGTALPINRAFTTTELGFRKTQKNPMYCGLSRGTFELLAVQTLNPIMIFAGKFAQDMLLFTTEEFNFFSLPDSFTTGSSIMPHKHNYDVFEIMRGHAHAFSSYSQQLQVIACAAGSGYNRELQLTKAVTLQAFNIAESTLNVLALVSSHLKLNATTLTEAMTGELLTVAQIDSLVQLGVPFRDAYMQVKENLVRTI